MKNEIIILKVLAEAVKDNSGIAHCIFCMSDNLNSNYNVVHHVNCPVLLAEEILNELQ